MNDINKLYSYYNKYEKLIKKTIFHPAFTTTHKIHKYFRENSKFAKGILLDLGCGTKPFIDILAPRIKRYLSFDYPVVQDSIAAFQQPDVYGNCLYLPFANDTLDTIVCSSVIEHVPDPFQMISEIARIMKKGAILILSGPGIACHVHGAPYDYFRLTEYGYEHIFERYGLKIEKTFYCGYLFASMACLFNEFIIKYLYKGKAYKKVLQIILLPITLLLIAVINLVAIIADKVFQNKEFCQYYFFVVRKI